MNKRTGVLSEYPSLTGFPLIPYYSCQSPLVILLITLWCPSILRLEAAARMRAEKEGTKIHPHWLASSAKEAVTRTCIVWSVS